MEVQDQINKFKEFFELYYINRILENIRKDKKLLAFEFNKLAVFSPELAEILIEDPEDTIRAAEIAVESIDFGLDEQPKIRIRISNLPAEQNLRIKNIRSKHIGKFIEIAGIIRQKSDVRPQVTSAVFECPSCGNRITVLQLDTKFREPSKCGCGRKGKFRLLSKDLVDAQRIVLEEAPESIEGGAQPKRLDIILKEDLVSPMTEKKTNPGSKISVTGILKEVPIIMRDGTKSTRFDLKLDANHIESVQEEFIEIELEEEEIKQIKEFSKDPQMNKKIIESMAPTIYGLTVIKQALLLQLLGGVRKERKDGTVTRGDIHILLIGDPGAGKSMLLQRVCKVAPKVRFVSGRGSSGAGLCVSPNSIVLQNPGGMECIKNIVESRLIKKQEYTKGVWKEDNINDIKIQSMDKELKLHSKNPKSVWKLQSPNHIYEITLRSGKKIELTANTKLFTIKQGKVFWKKSLLIKKGDYIGTPKTLIPGNINKSYIIDLINCNPVIHNVENIVKKIVKKLSKKYGSIRNSAKKLEIKENQLYHHWVNEKSRGRIKLKDFIKISKEINLDWKQYVKEVSVRNGKKHKIPFVLNKNLLYVAGLIAGDGDIKGKNKTFNIRLSNTCIELHKIFRKIIKEQFDLNFNVTKGTRKRPEATRFHSRILYEILKSLGIPDSPKSNKIDMSNKLLNLNNKLLSSFISGLYDTDGSINVRKTRGSDTIELTTCSEKLARKLQYVFLRYKIYSQLRTKSPTTGKIKGNYNRWVLEIRGKNNFNKFYSNFKLKHSKKKEKIQILIEKYKTKKSDTNIDIIPGISDLIKKELQKRKIPLKKAGWHPNLSSVNAKKIILDNNINEEYLNKIVKSDILWEKVKEVKSKKSKYKYVYDLTVSNSHNFIVDGILVHNTASVVKDEFIRGWALEAGALVLANKGLCAIDEFDKMTKEDSSAMHEALEQQTVTIAKANIHATLRAETTVLAAANPKYDRFDPYESIGSQINFPSTILNRFDLIFPIKDVPEKEVDEKLAGFILKLHQDEKANVSTPLTTEFVKKYIAYAKQSVKPKLTDAALKELQEYYVKMRMSGSEEGKIKAIPISARQLEALVRLSEAAARLRLDDKVTKKDARVAIELIHYCLKKLGLDPETGKIDIDRFRGGISATQRSYIKIVKDVINEMESKFGKVIPIKDVIVEAKKQDVDEDKVTDLIQKLKRSGDLFMPKNGYISKL